MTNGPQAIGIIMDGNRRWAKERGLPTLEGHRQGSERLRDVVRWARDADVREVTIYAFSTENWNRSKEEVEYLMKLFKEAFTNQFDEFMKEGVRIRFIGQRERMSEELQALMQDLEEKSRTNENGSLIIALSYGGQAEILSAANALLAEGKEQITEAELRSRMWSAGLLDPDLIIRTGGEKRLSNFLTWQSAYSELFFTDTMWPDFSEEEFTDILAEFSSRERRHGK
jgi:undecaprenyl diphosphate synthase